MYGAIINSSKVPLDLEVIISFLIPEDIDKQKSAIAIPINERNRLKRKFEMSKINEEFKPNLIFLHRNEFFDNIFPEGISKCEKISNKKIIVFSKLNNNSKC